MENFLLKNLFHKSVYEDCPESKTYFIILVCSIRSRYCWYGSRSYPWVMLSPNMKYFSVKKLTFYSWEYDLILLTLPVKLNELNKTPFLMQKQFPTSLEESLQNLLLH